MIIIVSSYFSQTKSFCDNRRVFIDYCQLFIKKHQSFNPTLNNFGSSPSQVISVMNFPELDESFNSVGIFLFRNILYPNLLIIEFMLEAS
jgi:hypothetical protein